MAVFFLKHGAVPSLGKAASDYAVGESVFLIESGSPVEYLVVNQGNPDTSLYDASCDGTWVLRKDIQSNQVWNAGRVNTYANSDINTWLNGTFYNTLSADTQAAVKQAKIPYCVGGGSTTIQSGANGLAVKVFSLGCYEMGLDQSDSIYNPPDGTRLNYFLAGNNTSANNLRIAEFNGTSVQWWTRSPDTSRSDYAWTIRTDGGEQSRSANLSHGVRPALILDSTTKFDPNTNIIL